MKISNTSNTPIFIQIANLIEEQILNGVYTEDMQIISTNELSSLLKINPNTILKGMNLLVDESILYKKRGLGIFVSKDALSIIKNKRLDDFNDKYIKTLVSEAKKLNISEGKIIEKICLEFENKEVSDDKTK